MFVHRDKRQQNWRGYLLLESMLALVLLSGFVWSFVSWSHHLQKELAKRETEVECYRLLYEGACEMSSHEQDVHTQKEFRERQLVFRGQIDSMHCSVREGDKTYEVQQTGHDKESE